MPPLFILVIICNSGNNTYKGEFHFGFQGNKYNKRLKIPQFS